MKLAFAHYSYSEDISGVTTWLEQLILRLQKDQVQLAVHLLHFGDVHKPGSILAALEAAGVDVEVSRRTGNLETDVRTTLAFLERAQPTLFLPQCLKSNYFAAAITGLQGLPWALTMHSDDPDYWAIAKARPARMYGGTTVAVSEHIAQSLVTRGLDPRPLVIPYGVNVPDRTATYRSDPFRIVYSGRLVETQKRLSLVTATLINACMGNSSLCATVIGDGPELVTSRRAVDKAGMSRRIVFAGRLEPERVRQELLDAQAILLMSDYEGLPVALLEAMAVGVVPVVRAIPSGIPELIQHERTGLLVDDWPEHAAQALSRLAGEPLLWQACSVAARELVASRYSEESGYRRWLACIEELHVRSSVRYPLQFSAHLDLPEAEATVMPCKDAAGWSGRTVAGMKRGLGGFARIFQNR